MHSELKYSQEEHYNNTKNAIRTHLQNYLQQKWFAESRFLEIIMHNMRIVFQMQVYVTKERYSTEYIKLSWATFSILCTP